MFKKLFAKREVPVVELVSHGLTFEVPRGKTLLEAAENAGIGFPCDCKVGTCGTCRFKLLDGKISELNSAAVCLSGEEYRDGWRLGCQTIALTNLRIHLDGLVSEVGPPPTLFEGRIAAAIPLSHDIVELRLQLNRPITFIAGQYADLQVEGIEGARSYSFAEAPAQGQTDSPCFHVRKVPGGAFTTWLFGGDRAGSNLTLRGPLGRFRLRQATGPIVCVAGGSGLAPIKCMLEKALNEQCARPVTLFYGAREQRDLYGSPFIADLAARWSARFDYVPVLSGEPEQSDWPGERGLVADKLLGLPELTQSQVYLCGPPPMVDAADAMARRAGVSADAVFADRFFDRSKPGEANPAAA
ncbi:TPA: 2Fe-2S iron-sulfur cluster binding domain-containing protein [Burkholderia vietnamiensis]|nr:2Fe-2S iron-sulfur cluster binding domain-containing protein [Burkholderia vietnamiensis]